MNSWSSTLRKLGETNVPVGRSWRPASRWQRASLLRLIAVAAEERLPLAPLLEAWALDQRGIQRQRIGRIVQWLHDGAPLPAAIEASGGALRDEELLAVQFGAQSGTLAASVRDALDRLHMPAPGATTRLRGTIVYGCVVAALMFGIVTFIQVIIAPKFQMIFADFGLEPPLAFEQMNGLASIVSKFWWIGAPVILALAWSLFSERPGRFLRYRVFGRRLRPLRDLRAAEVLDKLSVAAEAGRPVSGALSTLARYHFDPVMRHKLLFVRNEVEQGAEVWNSMGAAGLLTQPEIQLINASELVGNRPWALRQLAEGKKRRTRRLVQRWASVLMPIVVIAIGAVVLLQALAILTPLRELVFGFSA